MTMVFRLKSFLYIAINKKQLFLSYVVAYKKKATAFVCPMIHKVTTEKYLI